MMRNLCKWERTGNDRAFFSVCFALAGIVFTGLMAGKAEKPGSAAVWSQAGSAIALKLYRIEHGKYPGKISELVPEYLPKEFCSPKDGKPLSYSVKNGEFSLSADADGLEICSKR